MIEKTGWDDTDQELYAKLVQRREKAMHDHRKVLRELILQCRSVAVSNLELDLLIEHIECNAKDYHAAVIPFVKFEEPTI